MILQQLIVKTKTLLQNKLLLKLALTGLILFGVLFIVFPRQVTFSYAGDTCIDRFTILPGQHKTLSGDYNVVFYGEYRIGDLELWATKMCARATHEPRPGESMARASLFGFNVFAANMAIVVGNPPVANASSFDVPVPATKPLAVELSSQDSIYDYQLAVDQKKAPCSSQKSGIVCDLPALKLAQGKTYPVALLRSFEGGQEVSVAADELTIVTQANVVKNSVNKGKVVYEAPKDFVFEFDKSIEKSQVTLRQKGSDSDIATKVTIDDKKVTAAISEPLPREKEYTLTITDVESTDGGTLGEPYKVTFTLSGGPRVTGMNMGRTGAPMSGVLVLSLDQAVDTSQAAASFVSVKGANATVSLQERQIVIQYAGAAKCTNIDVVVSKGLKSKYGVVQTVGSKSSIRTACYTVETIGYSKQGRPIHAYFFGNGSSSVLFTGAIHGSEASSSLILQDLIQHLDSNAHSIPAHRQVVIVPTINPDGLARGSRNNANNVNLNRNFDTGDWMADIKDTNGTVKNGGGKAPMSEPEAKAIAALSSRLRPRLVMSYHAVGSVVIGNESGDSARLAGMYAQSVGYSNGTGNSSEIFDYEISGTYDDWLAQKLGVPSVIVELGSYSYRNFEHHRSAMWSMIK